MEKCIGCELCAGVCPARCIYVRGADNPSDAPVSPGERYGYVYEINMLRCIFCGLCVEACPTEAITMTQLFEMSVENRDDAVYTRSELLMEPDGTVPHPQPAGPLIDLNELRLADGWMRATAPSGRAAYEGIPAWTPTAGVGLRPPERGQRAEGGSSRCEPETRYRRPGRAGTGAMNAETVVFIVFAVAAVAGGLVMVLARNAVYSAIGLLTAMFSMAVFYVLNDAHFIAAVQVIIYAGAVMTLFLFVIMLIGVDRDDDTEEQIPLQRPLGLVLAAGLLILLLAAAGTTWFTGVASGGDTNGTIEAISEQLFGTWMIPFQATVLLLTVAAVGTIGLAHFTRRRRGDEPVEGGT